jgi:hypothetical protein
MEQQEQRNETVNWVAHQEDLPVGDGCIAHGVIGFWIIRQSEFARVMSLGDPYVIVCGMAFTHKASHLQQNVPLQLPSSGDPCDGLQELAQI